VPPKHKIESKHASALPKFLVCTRYAAVEEYGCGWICQMMVMTRKQGSLVTDSDGNWVSKLCEYYLKMCFLNGSWNKHKQRQEGKNKVTIPFRLK
jgi:hypothetical protein